MAMDARTLGNGSVQAQTAAALPGEARPNGLPRASVRVITRLRIAVLDPHCYAAEGLRALLPRLAEDIESVEIAGDLAEALDLVERCLPDAMVICSSVGGQSAAAVQSIKAISPTTKIMVLAAEDDRRDVIACMQAGISAYLSKKIDARELVRALQMVGDGEVVLSSFATSTLFQASESDEPVLTSQEQELLRLLAGGFDNSEMARAMFTSESTLKRLLNQLLKKLGARNRTQAAVFAATRGLV